MAKKKRGLRKQALKQVAKIKRQNQPKVEVIDTTTGEVLTLDPRNVGKKPKKKAKDIRKYIPVAEYEASQEKQQGYTPTVKYSDQIIELINALPDNRFAGKYAVEVTPLKETMINALYDTLAEYDTEEQYEEYLGTVYSVIQSGLEAIELSSDQTQIIANFSKALTLIKGKPLTMSEATTVSDYSETLGDYEM